MDAIDQSEKPKRNAAVGGKIVVVTAIVLLAALVCLLLIVRPARPGQWEISAVLLLCSVHLYLGAPWARWIVSTVLAIPGSIWTYQALSAFGQRPSWRVVILLAPAVVMLLIAGQLMFSGAVREFADRQFTRRETSTTKMLKVAWIVLLMGVLVTNCRDIV